MKLLHTKTLKDGRKHVLIELGPGEATPVAPVNEKLYYRLAYPHDDMVLMGHHISDPTPVYWDSYSQEWKDA